MRKFLVFLLTLVATSALAQVVPTTTKMSVSADSVMIGDTLRLNIEIEKDVAQELSIVGFKDNKLTEKIEIVGMPVLDTLSRTARHIKLRLSYLITSFDAGDYVLDKFPMLLGEKEPFDTVFAEGPVEFRVATYQIDTLTQQPVDIRDVLDAPFQWAEVGQWLAENWWIVAAVIFGCAIIFVAIWWYLRRKSKIEALNALPAHAKALMALEALHNKKMWQNGQMKEYFSLLTDILRIYIENRYKIGAMEMTSNEIIAAIKGENPEKLLTPIGELLSLADLVKFAKLQPDAQSCETAYFDVYYYVEQTKEQEQIVDEPKNENKK